jgi:hypothetical protein
MALYITSVFPQSVSFIKDWVQILTSIAFGSSSVIFVYLNYKENKRKNIVQEWPLKQPVWDAVCFLCENIFHEGKPAEEARKKFNEAYHEARLLFADDDPVSDYLQEVFNNLTSFRACETSLENLRLPQEQREVIANKKIDLQSWFCDQIGASAQLGERPYRPLDDVFRKHMGLE